MMPPPTHPANNEFDIININNIHYIVAFFVTLNRFPLFMRRVYNVRISVRAIPFNL